MGKIQMSNLKDLQPCKVVNGFYIREKKRSNLQIGMQNLDADKVYIYRYNPTTGRHEGQWCSPNQLLNKRR